ncbi:MAG: hypothetical protein Alpg2KO_14420 [Alphaproteobacteria bacterium]
MDPVERFMFQKIEDRDLDAIRQSDALVLYCQQHLPDVTRKGPEFVACCPFHHEKTPSFTLYRKGPVWRFKCFGCDAGGDAIEFFMRYNRGTDFRSAAAEMGRFAGLDITAPGQDRAELKAARDRAEALRAEHQRLAEEDEAAARIARLDQARRIWREAQPADGTLVERYLRARGIDLGRIGGVPKSLRFAPRCWHSRDEDDKAITGPAMIAAMMRPDRQFCGVHRTWLDRTGQGKADLSPNKKMLGEMRGNAIRLSKPRGNHLFLAEGIETALSILSVKPEEAVWAAGSLGNFAAVMLPVGVSSVTLCVDADQKDQDAADRVIRDAIWNFGGQDAEVRIARPELGMDFNDMLRAAE